MKENRNLVPVEVLKADATMSQMVSAGVTLHPDMRDRFILVAIKGEKMLSMIRVTTMSRESEDIPKMTTFGNQVLHPGVEGQALAVGDRVRPGFSRVRLTSQELVGQVNFPKYMLRNQVEGEGFRNTLLAYLANHVRRDFENLAINGDLTSTNDLLGMFDGMIAGMTSNVYQAGIASLSSSILAIIQETMPEEFEDQSKAYFTARRARNTYRRSDLAARATVGGDSYQLQNPAVVYEDEVIEKVPLFPTTLGIGSNETAVLYFDPKQFIWAFHEDIEIETDYDYGARTWQVFLTCRVAMGFEHEPACVKGTEVLAA